MAVEEWDRRQLCPDGACTGVIGATGVCTTCGRAAPNWGDERKRGLRNPTDAPPIVKDDDDIAPSAPAALGEMADWGMRRLCLDGSCIGVVGPNNRCKVCGKPGPTKAKASAAPTGDGELARVAAEMAGTATATDLASIEPARSDEDDDEYEEEDDEYEDESESDADEASDHDHGDENDADEADSGEDASDDEDDDEDEDSDDEDEDDESDDEDDGDDDPEGDDDGAISAAGGRELCPDGACIGVLGDDGRCRVCKKPRDWKDERA